MSQEIIRLVNISKSYHDVQVLRDINLYILRNEFITLLGPSGCGKTTTLRILGGFESPCSGDILFEGVRINDVPPFKRKVNTVFQQYALFPHMNVYENIAFGLKVRKMENQLVARKVHEVMEMMNLGGFEKRDVESLSGGQKQRVAIARAVVNEPEVLLLDEPLGALDLKLRKEMQIELKNIQQRLGITFVFVTHDQEEALTMSDTIVVMNQGSIQQVGTPIDIYNEPKNVFVADFIGESNIVEGIMITDYLVHFCGQSFQCVDRGFAPEEHVDVIVRPEDVKLVPEEEGMILGQVMSAIFKGVHYEMMVQGEQIKWMVHSTQLEPIGKTVGIKVLPNDIHIMKKVKPD